MYTDNISFTMCSLRYVPLCRKLVGCPTENSQVYTLSTSISLTSIHVQLYPVTGKIYKKIYMY